MRRETLEGMLEKLHVLRGEVLGLEGAASAVRECANKYGLGDEAERALSAVH